MTRNNSKNRASKAKRNKPEKLEFVQPFLPVKDIQNGIVETTDGRYVKILEIEPINFMLRSSEEQYNILSSFASWLKISPMRLQFKSITRKADSDKHIAMLRQEMADEDNAQCKELSEDYIRLIKDVGSREALTRRFFLIFQYEAIGRNESDDYSKIYSMLDDAGVRFYVMDCVLEYPKPESGEWKQGRVEVMDFLCSDIYEEGLAERVQASNDAAEDYYDEMDAIKKEEELGK